MGRHGTITQGPWTFEKHFEKQATWDSEADFVKGVGQALEHRQTAPTSIGES